MRVGRTNEAAHALAVGATGEPSWPDPWSDALAEHRVGFAQTLKAATHGVLAGDFNRAMPLFEKLLDERPDDLSLMQAKVSSRLFVRLLRLRNADAGTLWTVFNVSGFDSSLEALDATDFDVRSSLASRLSCGFDCVGTAPHSVAGRPACRREDLEDGESSAGAPHETVDS